VPLGAARCLDRAVAVPFARVHPAPLPPPPGRAHTLTHTHARARAHAQGLGIHSKPGRDYAWLPHSSWEVLVEPSEDGTDSNGWQYAFDFLQVLNSRWYLHSTTKIRLELPTYLPTIHNLRLPAVRVEGQGWGEDLRPGTHLPAYLPNHSFYY
jgi:hypothetical protein